MPLQPTPTNLLHLLKSSSTVAHLSQLHANLTTNPPPSPHLRRLLLHALIRTYNAHGLLTIATRLFHLSPPPTTPLLYNVLIRAHSKSSLPLSALLLFRLLLRNRLSLSPDKFTFTFALSAASRVCPVVYQAVHAQVVSWGCGGSVFVGNVLVNGYSVLGWVGDARKVFDRMRVRDVVSWTSIVGGYVGIGELGVATELFEGMPERNEVSWAVVISGCVKGGFYEEAIRWFQGMFRCGGNPRPNEAALVSVLSSCAHIGALEEGKRVHNYVRDMGLWSSNINTALIDMYAKCGRIECAKGVFDDSGLKMDVWTWTSMISGLSMHGLGREAVEMFDRMIEEGVRPDSVTLVGVLNGCSHSGLIREGTSIFDNMNCLWGIPPDIAHYGCLVDLLGRAGELDEAFRTVVTMPIEPDIIMWRSLLSACRIHSNVDLAERVLEKIARLHDSSEHHESRVLLSNLYAATNRWEGVSKMRNPRSVFMDKDEFLMKGRTQSKPGFSWITDKDGIVHRFISCEMLHPKIEAIRQKLEEVLKRVRVNEGYVANTRNALFDLTEEEKEQAVAWHSEKLALAFGLMTTEDGSSIMIMKNLRICEDCHSLMKVVSGIYGREIVVRDRSRFHTFKGGQCSCHDYW